MAQIWRKRSRERKHSEGPELCMNLVCLGSSKGRSEDLTGAGAERRGAGRSLRPLPAGPRESVGFLFRGGGGSWGGLEQGRRRSSRLPYGSPGDRRPREEAGVTAGGELVVPRSGSRSGQTHDTVRREPGRLWGLLRCGGGTERRESRTAWTLGRGRWCSGRQ